MSELTTYHTFFFATAACVPLATVTAAAAAAAGGAAVGPELQQVQLAARDTIFNEAHAANAPRLVADTRLYGEVRLNI
jgi:hypothetical protein